MQLPTSQAPQVPPLQAAKHVFSEKIVIAVTVTDYYVLDSAPGTEQLFAVQPALFLLLRCEFHVVYHMYSPESFQKLCHSTRRACSHAKATSKPVIALAALVPMDRTRDESRERWGRMANPSAIDRTGEEPGESVSFQFFGDCFHLFWAGNGGGGGGEGGLPFELVWRLAFNIFGDQLSIFLSPTTGIFF